MEIKKATPLSEAEKDRLTSPPEMKVVYSVERPSGEAGRIEVYGDPARNWYDWRVIDANGEVVIDTAVEGSNWGQYSDDARALSSALTKESGTRFMQTRQKRKEIHRAATAGRGGLQ
ncbi:hypothetical protein [Vreelandella alkaliphila]|uniref:Uncharacterized protein n=1 Tax=Vreelandella alkaliphila TaxID=272774 RepID=A0AAJ2VQJ6_9GAMM|nr:hypothetical protein [Halomonas alkaliphila]MDX5979617.1 hypothetical protein [Halomonas alkaliphila]